MTYRFRNTDRLADAVANAINRKGLDLAGAAEETGLSKSYLSWFTQGGHEDFGVRPTTLDALTHLGIRRSRLHELATPEPAAPSDAATADDGAATAAHPPTGYISIDDANAAIRLGREYAKLSDAARRVFRDAVAAAESEL